MSVAPIVPPNPARHHARVAIAWAIFVIYGSLVPLEYRPHPNAWESFLHIRWLNLGVGSRADWVANIILYIVLSYFATGAVWSARIDRAVRVFLLAAMVGSCIALAIGIEYLQQFFPPRTVSINDLFAETIGTGLGVVFWFVSGRHIAAMWQRFIVGGNHSIGALLALYAIAYLAFSFFPYDFLVSSQELASKLAKPGSITWSPGLACGKSFTCGVKLLAEAVLLIPFGVLLVFASHRGKSGDKHKRISPIAGFITGAAIGVIVEAVQIALASGTTQAISILTRAFGAAWGVMLMNSEPSRWFLYSARKVRLAALIALPFYVVLVLALGDLFPPQLQPLWAAAEKLEGLRFMPFYYHYYTTETAAVRSLLFVAGSYAPIGIVSALGWPNRTRAGVWLSVILAVVFCTVIEVLKLFSLGKRPDPTNLLIAGATTWLAQWTVHRVLSHLHTPSSIKSPPEPSLPSAPFASRHRFILGVAGPIAALITAVALTAPSASPLPASDAAPAATFPPPEALPAAQFAHFNAARPRLPHPSATDIEQLRLTNRAYLDSRSREARNGAGSPDAVIFSAYVAPGSQDLKQLHRQLMALRFSERGDRQVKPLAMAYDWLYPQWSTAERAALQEKLSEGCGYVVNFIRKEALSPYNVFLYNSPLQALMACSITLYRDAPRGDAFMAFTTELWKNRVLPVWRQIMGRNGGWHEGGEYVSVSIGQAIYTLPAMWRAATGEDLFRSEPGIRGFLDFLVYRNRPDGTQLRWGDGSYFLRPVPDAVPLALEYRHAAAYSLNPPKGPPAPTAWPWGPLSDDTLVNPHAANSLPLARLFDGIGMLVARSDWTPDATYVTFKAGDNYWSHSHLDQGAFTIYKGGELAIDSGWYGPAYGSDHHMNYTYQSIAHNLVTVTDPADVEPGPGFDKDPRPYANDGGQRRIGSGWGVEEAPLDRSEWEKQRDTYHTAQINRHLEQDGLSVAVADLTPAYTNSQSGHGTFSHRTRRVERMWRTFGYDHANDAIIVFDDVIASDPSFRKRWLLHSQYAPTLLGADFHLIMPHTNILGKGGGTLEGHVLLPAQPMLNVIGGPGFEFFVDGKNYDENGKARAALRNTGQGQPEPGAWRIELMPSSDAAADQFLVVMLPTSSDTKPKVSVRRLSEGMRVGAEIVGPQRTTRWWYEAGKQGVQVEVSEGGKTRTYALMSQ